MKRLIAILVVMVLVLSGCSASSPSTSKAMQTTTTTTIKATTSTAKTTSASTSATTTAPTTTKSSASIKLIKVSSPVKAGSNATIEVQGLPNTQYNINVNYGTTDSTAKGLENKTSDKNGRVSWTWRVGSNTGPGNHSITIIGKDQRDVFGFTVK